MELLRTHMDIDLPQFKNIFVIFNEFSRIERHDENDPQQEDSATWTAMVLYCQKTAAIKHHLTVLPVRDEYSSPM